jgi:hypothetical protein
MKQFCNLYDGNVNVAHQANENVPFFTEHMLQNTLYPAFLFEKGQDFLCLIDNS